MKCFQKFLSVTHTHPQLDSRMADSNPSSASESSRRSQNDSVGAEEEKSSSVSQPSTDLPTTEILPDFPLRDDLVQDGFFIHRHPDLASGGRCLAQRHRKLRAGSILFREFPIVAALRPDQLSLRCHSCWLPPAGDGPGGGDGGGDGIRLKRCGGCRTVRYCSVKCQKSHWALKESGDQGIPGGHKLECKVLQTIQQRSSKQDRDGKENHEQKQQEQQQQRSPITLPVTMMLLRLWLYQLTATPAQKQRSLRRFEALSHRLEAHTEEQKMDYAQVVQAVNAWLEQSGLAPSGDSEEAVEARKLRSKTLFQWLGRLNVNAHTITTEDLMGIGAGIYPVLAILNHSCRPNCSFVFYGPYVEVRAIRDIPSGEPLTISYIDIAQTTPRRQAELFKNYFFRCSCPLCVPSGGTGSAEDRRGRDDLLSRLDPISSSSFPDGVTLAGRKTELQKILRNESRVSGAVRIAHIRQGLRILEQELRAGTAHQDRHSLLREVANLLIFEARWKEALEAAEALLESSEIIYGGSVLGGLHPMLGLDRLMVARLRDYTATMPEAEVHRMNPSRAVQLAITNLTRNIELWRAALQILELTHGDRISLVREARESLQRAEQELHFMRRQQRRQDGTEGVDTGGPSLEDFRDSPSSSSRGSIKGPPKIEVLKD